jgi:hypothetical protein
MFIKNKRGLGVVIGTVLIIILSLVIVGAIGAVVIPIVREKITEVNSCLEAQFSLELVNSRVTCSATASELSGFTVKINKEGIKKFRVSLLDKNGELKIYDVKEGDIVSGIGMYSDGVPGIKPLQIPNVGQQLTYVANGANVGVEVTKIEIAPIARNVVCNIEDSVGLKSCPSDVNLGTINIQILFS